MKKILIALLLCAFSQTAFCETATIYSNANDCLIGIAGLLNARDSQTGSIIDTTSEDGGGQCSIAAYSYGSTYYYYRSYLKFSSDIPAGSTITSIVLSVYGKSGVYNQPIICAVSSTFADTPTVADFGNKGTTSFGTVKIVANQYNNITLNAAGLSYFTTPGDTKIFLMVYGAAFSHGTVRSYTDIGYIYYSEYPGTDRDPKLVVTYTPPPAYYVSGTLKEKESDATGSAMEYLVLNRSTGDVFAFGTAAADGTYSVEVADGATEYDVYMLDPADVYAPKTIGEMVLGVTP